MLSTILYLTTQHPVITEVHPFPEKPTNEWVEVYWPSTYRKEFKLIQGLDTLVIHPPQDSLETILILSNSHLSPFFSHLAFTSKIHPLKNTGGSLRTNWQYIEWKPAKKSQRDLSLSGIDSTWQTPTLAILPPLKANEHSMHSFTTNRFWFFQSRSHHPLTIDIIQVETGTSLLKEQLIQPWVKVEWRLLPRGWIQFNIYKNKQKIYVESFYR